MKIEDGKWKIEDVRCKIEVKANIMEQVFISIKKMRLKLIVRRIINYISNRLKGGIIYEKLKINAYNFYKKKDFSSLKIMFFYILTYFLSGTIAKRFIKIKINNDEELIKYEISSIERDTMLFHWAPKDKLENILMNGLLPSINHDYVFVSDNSDYIKNKGYLFLKTLNYHKKEMVFVKIVINTSKLAENHKIFKTFRKHEYIVDKVPPDCILKEDE